MSAQIFDEIVGDVLTICPTADHELARIWTRDSFRRLREKRHWSWLIKSFQIIIPAAYTTGTVSVTSGLSTVTGSSTVFADSHVGQQFRISGSNAIHTITRVDSATSMEIVPVWGAADASAQSYTIAQLYITPPDDFLMWDSVIDATNGRQLWTSVQRHELDYWDPKRSRSSGYPSLLAQMDYGTSYEGKVHPVVRIEGTTGQAPVSSGTYTGVSDALYAILIDGFSGPTGCTYSYRKDGGALTTGQTSSVDWVSLGTDGVQVRFPAALYAPGDSFAIRATAIPKPGLPRYELYPHQTAQTVLIGTYVSAFGDIDDYGIVIPRSIRADVIREGALEFAATYPGTDQKPNPYAQINRRDYHAMNFERLCTELERQDDEIYERNVVNLPYAQLPWKEGIGRSQLYDPPYIYGYE